ncbi:Flagellar hook-length control protein [Variovorax sp. PBS-H4]|uniref:flagellar hook-length control protein FliK n=1 Tax=Variovorax sp. PBS-H4 TaxID=434008 RepID=UPI001316C5F2|nr:flagellar hook-length control protein FliK [Variovorax sp. PBS-H4]VTU26865.1 Flagellar hook-length control protein [Variovorax sp. PBS-H4]
MPTFIPPASLPASSAQPAAQPTARGRAAADENARGGFGAVLERSRASARRGQDGTQAASDEAAATPQKPHRPLGRKEEPGSELLTIALFAPQILSTAPAAAIGTSAGTRGAALPGAGAALPQDASLAATASLASTAAAHASASTDQDAQPDAKAPLKGAAVDTATSAAASSTADKGFALPGASPASSAREGGDAVAQTAAASPLPLAGALPSAKPAAEAGTTTASAANDTKAASAISSTALDAASAAAQSGMSAAAADNEGAPAPEAPPALLVSASPMQPALDRAQPAASPAPAQTLAPPVGSAEWAPALGHQVLRMTAGGQQVAELNLNPAGLGPLKITLSLGDNQAQAMFVSAHESVRKAVEAALPQLRSTLAEQGISLGQTSVGAESRPWAGAGDFARQQEQRQNASANGTNNPGAGRSEAAAAIALPARTSPPSRTSAIDTFA